MKCLTFSSKVDRRDSTGKLVNEAPRHPWPATLGDARRLIAATFAKQGPDGWDARSIRFYMNDKGVRPQPVDNLDAIDCRKLLIHLADARMINFETRPDAAAPPISAITAAEKMAA